MKKLISILLAVLMIFSLTACNKGDSGTENKTPDVETKTVKLFKDSYITLLNDDLQNKMHDLGITPEDNEFAVIGMNITDFTFTSTAGEEVRLPVGKPFILEVVGSWCTYCQALTKEIIENRVYDDIPVYQLFLYGTNDDVISFYDSIGIDKPDEIVAMVQNQEFEAFLENYEFYSVPLTIVVDENGKIALTHVGYVENDRYSAFIDLALENKIYNEEVEGTTLMKFISEQYAARQYINSLTEIDVPTSLLK